MAPTTTDLAWSVVKWNGRSQAALTTIYRGDEASARARYAERQVVLLHGLVQLVSPSGTVAASASAPSLETRTLDQTMHAEDRCPSTGALCRNDACERGGCRKMRAGPPAAARKAATPAARRAADPSSEQSELAALRRQLDTRTADCARLASVLTEAIDALEQVDASLTHLQQSLGVRSSPKLDAVRAVKAKLRGATRAFKPAGQDAPALPASEIP